MRLPMTLAPVRSNVFRATSLSRPSSPPSPSPRFSRKNRSGKTHCCRSVHCANQRCTSGSSPRSPDAAKPSMARRPTAWDSGATNPSSDIDTLKNTVSAISAPPPAE